MAHNVKQISLKTHFNDKNNAPTQIRGLGFGVRHFRRILVLSKGNEGKQKRTKTRGKDSGVDFFPSGT